MLNLEMVSKYDNVLAIESIYNFTDRGMVIGIKVIKGEFSVGDTVRMMDDAGKEYVQIPLGRMRDYSTNMDKVTQDDTCEILLQRDNDLKKEIENQRILSKYMYAVR